MVPELSWYLRHLRSLSLRFLRGKEWTHLSSKQSSVTNSLACCSTANCLAKIEMATEQNDLGFINSPASPPVWCGEGRALVCAGLHGPCGREIRPGSVYQPLMRKVWVLHSLGSAPAWACRDKAGSWASLPSSFSLGCRQLGSHTLGQMEGVGFHTCPPSSWLRWQLGTFKWIGLMTFLRVSPGSRSNLDE